MLRLQLQATNQCSPRAISFGPRKRTAAGRLHGLEAPSNPLHRCGPTEDLPWPEPLVSKSSRRRSSPGSAQVLRSQAEAPRKPCTAASFDLAAALLQYCLLISWRAVHLEIENWCLVML